MVAIAIFMMIIAVIYSTWALVMRATQVGQDAAAQAQRERVALHTIEDSLMCIQSFQASLRYYSFHVPGDGDPTFYFASRLPDVFPRNGKFDKFNLRQVSFSLENGADGEKNLVLRQHPIQMDWDEDEQKNPLILLRNVKTFSVECWDTNQSEWVTDWENTNSIPPMLRIGLVFGGNTSAGGAAPEKFVVRSFSIPSQMMPLAVQRGGGGPGGPGGPGGNVPPINFAPGGGRGAGKR